MIFSGLSFYILDKFKKFIEGDNLGVHVEISRVICDAFRSVKVYSLARAVFFHLSCFILAVNHCSFNISVKKPDGFNDKCIIKGLGVSVFHACILTKAGRHCISTILCWLVLYNDSDGFWYRVNDVVEESCKIK